MYCNECGTQNPNDAIFCNKCGSKLGKLDVPETHRIKQFMLKDIKLWQMIKNIIGFIGLIISWLLAIFFGIIALVGIIGYEFEEGIITLLLSLVIFPPFTKIVKDKFNFNLSYGLKIVIFFSLFIIFGYIAQTVVLIPADPSQILPIIMFNGSQKLDEIGNNTYAKREFGFVNGFTERTIIYEVNKFTSIDEAINNYNSIKDNSSYYKDVILGDEGFGFTIENSTATVVFRKANAVVKVESVDKKSDISLEDAVSYARLVKTPTSKFKLAANMKILRKGDSWYMGHGYFIKVLFMNAKSNPKLVSLELSRVGTKLDEHIIFEGKTYNYGEEFFTTIDSISDNEITLKNTYYQTWRSTTY